MQVELKKIKVLSLLVSALPVLLLIIGVVGGLFTFILLPDPGVASRLPQILQRNMAAGVFALAYTAATILFLVIVALLYNLLVSLGLPGVKVIFAAPSEEGAGTEIQGQE
ncbi:MAG: hypothetical protein HY547_03260 [Elusimicrobia bacterium]|nr:hypothetical protein [Elusimicrobiota bacterium]